METKYTLDSQTKDKELIVCSLLRKFYDLGWCKGSGGGISIREAENYVWIAPSGVQKELVRTEDLYLMSLDGKVIEGPSNKELKCSECTPLFLAAYNLRNAGAVLHSHSLNTVLVTMMFEHEVVVRNLEMIKGFRGFQNTSYLTIPIIENTEYESELTENLKNAIVQYPKSYAVLVRNHGIYVWGDSWEKAKVHVECYDYLFEALIEMRKLGIDIHNHNNKTYGTKIKTVNETTFTRTRELYRFIGDGTICKQDQNIRDVVRAWLIDPQKLEKNNIREDLQYDDNVWVNSVDLLQIGVLHWRLSGNKDDEYLNLICKERNYTYKDFVTISKNMENYDTKIETFKQEHYHKDEEIRYCLGGSGYFDVRDLGNQWVRIHFVKGDMIILPEGIYHRFVPDINDYIEVMRLFASDPVWTAYNRNELEDLKCQSRLKYVEKYKKIK